MALAAAMPASVRQGWPRTGPGVTSDNSSTALLPVRTAQDVGTMIVASRLTGERSRASSSRNAGRVDAVNSNGLLAEIITIPQEAHTHPP